MSMPDAAVMDVLQNIEAGLKMQYQASPGLTDSMCCFALDNAKIAIKQKFGYARNEKVSGIEGIQGVISWCVAVGEARIDKVNSLTLHEYVACLDRVKKSVERHSRDGSRAYYEFIRNFV